MAESMKHNMAALRTLETTELLEMVLLNLSLKELFRVQRVCKTWREVIQASPRLKQAIFLGHGPSWGHGHVRMTAVRNNSTYDDRPRTERTTKSNTAVPVPVPSRLTDGTTRAKAIMYKDVLFNPIFPSEENTIRFLTSQFQEKESSKASWLDMYLTQPPCTYVHVTVYYTKQLRRSMMTGWRIKSSGTGIYLVEVRREGGVRARDVLEDARRCTPAKDVVQWHRIDMFVPGVVKKVP